ncbi:MAG: AAA family ATPase [Desulfurococcales archaeon]|nr:AAA family ATPase [Desulfurococcales archaeon]
MDILLLIAVTGMPGSGKSSVAKAIAEILGAEVYVMGDVVRREVARRGLELNTRNLEAVASELRRLYGRSAVAKLLLEELRGLEAEYTVIDGLRGREEAEVFRSLGGLCIVAVHSSPLTRYRRLLARGRRDDIRGWDDFRLRDERNIEFGIGEVIALADYMIVNEGSLEDLRKASERVAVAIRDGKGKDCSGGGGTPNRGLGEG